MPVTLVVFPKAASADATVPDGLDACVTFDGTRVAIGRGGSCDLVLPDASVSLRHASIRTTQLYTHLDSRTVRSVHTRFHPRA